MTRRFAPILLAVLSLPLSLPATAADGPRLAVPVPEAATPADLRTSPAPASFVGQVLRRDATGRLAPMPARRSGATPAAAVNPLPRTLAFGDYYVLDGSQTAVAVNLDDGENLVVGYNQGWDFDPDIPVSNSTSGNGPWAPRPFPTGAGVYTGYPFDSWCVAGNTAGEFFVSALRADLMPADNSRVVIARSTDGGATFAKFYEVARDYFADRAMVDVDRTAARGGTSGGHDGKLYVCFDEWTPSGASYLGSYLRVVDSGGVLRADLPLSGTGAVPFRGSQFQPVAGLNDGQVFLVSSAIADGGATNVAYFHEITGAGAGTTTWFRSTLSWSPAGQQLGTSTRWGVNGHRVDQHGTLAIDRTNGPRRGRLYFITNRNPNPWDPTRDQGDLYLSSSTNSGASWNTVQIPTIGGRTQYFPMLDVDQQGWLHVAYYENGAGLENYGALNAGSASVLYTVSRDAGASWSPGLLVNEPAHKLVLDDPPLDLGAADYYLLGDYMQVRATGTWTSTSAYVLWTQFDARRENDMVGNKKERVMATRMSTPIAPASSTAWSLALALALAAAGAAAQIAARRRPVTAGPSGSRTGRSG